MSIRPDSSAPIFQQIADHVRRDIAAGVYRAGEMIPSLRAMSLELKVNPNTVQRAYELLEREGVIHARKGLGMFVTQKGVQAARDTSRAGVAALFRQGIHSGQAANMSPNEIRDSFDRAWHETGLPVPEEKL